MHDVLNRGSSLFFIVTNFNSETLIGKKSAEKDSLVLLAGMQKRWLNMSDFTID